MFIATIGPKDNPYVCLRESFRDEKGKPRARTLKRFGRLKDLLAKDPLALEKIKAQYKNENDTKKAATLQYRYEQFEKELKLGAKDSESENQSTLLGYGHYVLKQLWEEDLALPRKIRYLQKTQTQVKYDINAALAYLTFMKVIDPASVLDRFDAKDDFLGDPAKKLDLHHLYNCLDFAKQSKDEIMKWVNRQLNKKLGTGRATMVFYDVTNAYFESALTDAEMGLEQKDFMENLYAMAVQARAQKELPEDCFDKDGNLVVENLPQSFIDAVDDEKIQYLRMRGPSKEHRYDLPIVSIALVIDSLGMPMDFAVFAGNESEFKSMRKAIAELKEKYGITDVTVSADRGINSVQNLKMLHDSGLGFLVAQKVTQFDRGLTAKMLDETRYIPFDPNNPGLGRYQVIEHWKKKSSTNKDDSVECTLVLTFNEKRRARDEAILKVWRSIVENKKEKREKLGPRKTGWAALADIGEDQDKPILGVNEEVYEHKLELCGYAALVYAPATDSKGKNLSQLAACDIAHAYKRQCRIEECFRIMKSNIGLRPMYVWTSDHIRGHVTICVLALLLIRLLQHKLENMHIQMSINEMIFALKQASVMALKHREDDVMFFSCGYKPSLRKGREFTKTEDLLEEVKNGKQKINGISELMRAADLEPIPLISTRAELAKCLKTRFVQLEDAIPILRLATM